MLLRVHETERITASSAEDVKWIVVVRLLLAPRLLPSGILCISSLCLLGFFSSQFLSQFLVLNLVLTSLFFESSEFFEMKSLLFSFLFDESSLLLFSLLLSFEDLLSFFLNPIKFLLVLSVSEFFFSLFDLLVLSVFFVHGSSVCVRLVRGLVLGSGSLRSAAKDGLEGVGILRCLLS